MNIIYYNKDTGTFCEFEISDIKDEIASDTSKKEYLDVVLQHALSEIKMWGNTREFPEDLMKSFVNEIEVDLFLMANFDIKAKEILEDCLFYLVELKDMKTYLHIDTNEIVASEAIGKKSVILYKEKNSKIISAAKVSFSELEEKFVQV